MKNFSNIIIACVLAVAIICASNAIAGGKTQAPAIDYWVYTIQKCKYVVCKISIPNVGSKYEFSHAGSCTNPVHSIYGRIAKSNEEDHDG